MATVDAILATTHLLPSIGYRVLTKDLLEQVANSLRENPAHVLRQHDLDQPLEGVRVSSAEVLPTDDGEYALHVTYEAPDDVAAEMVAIGGMSIGFAAFFHDPEDEPDADVNFLVDPRAYTGAELDEAATRLAAAGLKPRSGLYYQLSEVTLPVVILDILRDLPYQLGWAVLTGAIIEGTLRLVRPGRKARHRFVLHGENGVVVAEIETSSKRAYKEAVRALPRLDLRDGGPFIRDKTHKEWRQAGEKPPRRARRKDKGKRKR